VNRYLAAAIAGVTIAGSSAIVWVAPASALTGREVNDISREVTVLISGQNSGHGSGTIVHRSGNTYYVLTAAHVVRANDTFKLVTPDKQAHQVETAKIKRLGDVDLAIVKFTSTNTYQVAKLSSARTSEGQVTLISGWPKPDSVGNEAGGAIVRQFTQGNITGYLPTAFRGYSMTYSNLTRQGMSGGGVFDAGGRLIGVHGLGGTEDVRGIVAEGSASEAAVRAIASRIKPGFNYAIPISTFLQRTDNLGIDSDLLSVETTIAPELGAAYVANNAQPDDRDRISDVGKVLQNINNTVETIEDTQRTVDRVRRLLPF
jgi:serine protease Do